MDKIHAQIHPDAMKILAKHFGEIPRGWDSDGTPNFKGLPEAWWKSMHADKNAVFWDLIDICRTDYPTFAALLLKVFNKRAGMLQPFILNDAQVILNNIEAGEREKGNGVFLNVLKARQLGITTNFAGKQFWILWRDEDQRTLMLAHTEPLLKEIVAIHRLFYESLPDIPWVKPQLPKATKGATISMREVSFQDRRSKGDTAVAKEIEQRGSRRSSIVLSEGAFYPDLAALLDALMPQLPPRGSIARADVTVCVETTPQGQNAFYVRWQQAKKPESEWRNVFLPWFIAEDIYSLVPPTGWRMTDAQLATMERLSLERRKLDGKDVTRAQMYWREQTIINDCHSEEAFDMEYPSDDQTCFLMYESESIFKNQLKALTQDCQDADIRAARSWKKYSASVKTDGPVLCDLEFKAPPDPFKDTDFNRSRKPRIRVNAGELWVWEPPIEGHIYIAGADLAGAGSDNAILSIVDVTEQRQVAEMATKRNIIEFADFSVQACLWYNSALLYPELNYIGHVFVDRVTKLWRYPFLGREEKWGESSLGKRYGFVTGEHTKGPLIANLEWYISERFVKIASRDLLAELSTFNYDGVTSRGNPMYSAASTKHDDRVIAMALALWAVKQSPKMRSLMSKRLDLPDAVDLGINSAPQNSKWSDNLPTALQNILGEADKTPVYQNYIRGFGDY